MISETALRWGGGGSIIRELSAHGARRAKEVGPENVFDFAIGSPSADPPAALHAAVRRLMDSVPPAELHTYVPAPGIPSVRARIADFLNTSFSMAYRPEDICLTDGASSALALVCRALLSPGEEVIIPTPAFPEYWVYVESVGAEVKAVPCLPDSFQLDLAALEAAVTEKTALVILNSPNNPSGAVYPREDLEQLTAMLSRRERELGRPIYLLADEPYRELVYGGAEVPFLPAIYPDAIYCYSFSKSLSLPGERIGYLALHPETTDYGRVRAAVYGAGRALGYINVSSLFQRVAADCAGQTADLSVYAKNRDFIYAALTRMGFSCVRPDGAFYLFLKTPSDDSRFFCQKAMERDVLLIPGDEFGCPGYARLAYCVPPETLQRSLPAFQALAKDFGL